MRVSGDVMKIDWTNLDQVMRLARKFGPGQTVFKVEGRANYNIAHTARPDRWMGHTVYLQT